MDNACCPCVRRLTVVCSGRAICESIAFAFSPQALESARWHRALLGKLRSKREAINTRAPYRLISGRSFVLVCGSKLSCLRYWSWRIPIGLAACHIADARVKHVGLDSIAAASELTLRRCRYVSFITRPRWIDGGPHSFALYRQALQDQGRVINFYCSALNAFASSHSGYVHFQKTQLLVLEKAKNGLCSLRGFQNRNAVCLEQEAGALRSLWAGAE